MNFALGKIFRRSFIRAVWKGDFRRRRVDSEGGGAKHEEQSDELELVVYGIY